MARRLKEATEQPKRGVTGDVVRSYDRKIDEAKARMDEARGEVAQFVKQFDDIGGDRAALKLAMKLKRMEDAKARAFWGSLNQYVDDLGVFAQGDMFDQNAVTPADSADAAKRNEIAEAQGKRAGLDGANLDSNPYAEDDPARPFWSKGWRDGQNELAAKFAAPAGGDQPPAAEKDPLEIPPSRDRRPGRRSARIPDVPTVVQ